MYYYTWLWRGVRGTFTTDKYCIKWQKPSASETVAVTKCSPYNWLDITIMHRASNFGHPQKGLRISKFNKTKKSDKFNDPNWWQFFFAALSNSSTMFFSWYIYIFSLYYISLFSALLNIECLFMRTSIANNSSWTLISNFHTFFKN